MNTGVYNGIIAAASTYCRTGLGWNLAYAGGILLYMMLSAGSLLFLITLFPMFRDPRYRQGRLLLSYLCFALVNFGSCVHILTTSRPGFFRGLWIDLGIFFLAILLLASSNRKNA